MVANSIHANDEELYHLLISLMQKPEIFLVYQNVIFYLLNHFESEVGLKVQLALMKMASLDDAQFFLQEKIIENLVNGIKSENSEVQIRFAEIIIQASNHS